jgi:aubergine-like protein
MDCVVLQVDLVRWIIIHSPRDVRFANEFAGMMQKVGPQMGIQVCDARIMRLSDDTTDSYLRMLRQNINPSLQLVVIIFPTARDDRYSAVKKLCCSEMPVASQVSSLLVSKLLNFPPHKSFIESAIQQSVRVHRDYFLLHVSKQ